MMLVCLIGVVGWRNQRRIHDLRMERDALLGLPEEVVVSDAGGRGAGDSSGGSRGYRNGREEGGNDGVGAVLDYARGLPFPEDVPAVERMRRVVIETERIQQMDREQLKRLIEELSGAEDVGVESRMMLVSFALLDLCRSQPKDAFAWVEQLKDLVSLRELLPDLIEIWGEIEPVGGRAWLDGRPAWLPENLLPELEQGFLKGAIKGDPALALEWIAERGERGEIIRWLTWARKHLSEDAAEEWQVALVAHPVTSGLVKDWLAAADLAAGNGGRSVEAGRGGGEKNHPVASPIPGKPGYVFSPYTNRVVDVRDIPSGTLVMDPEVGDGGYFLVP